MLKRLLGVLALSSLLFSGTYADDILAIVSKGKVSDTSAGVKVLSLEEEMQVKGGYRFIRNSNYDTYGSINARSYAYIVTDGLETYGSAYNVARELGYYNNYLIVAKYRYTNGQKQHYLTYATPSGKTYEFWQYYGNAQKVLQEFRTRY